MRLRRTQDVGQKNRVYRLFQGNIWYLLDQVLANNHGWFWLVKVVIFYNLTCAQKKKSREYF